MNWDKLKPFLKRCGSLVAFQKAAYPIVLHPQMERVIVKGPEWSPAHIDERFDELIAVFP
jgi:hypothetical protein